MTNIPKNRPFKPHFKLPVKRLALWTVAVFVFYLSSYLMDPLHIMWADHAKRTTQQILVDELISVVFCIIIAETSMLIDRLLNKTMPWRQHMGTRIFIQTIFQMLASVIVVLFIGIVFMDAYKFLISTKTKTELTAITQIIASNIAVALAISAINTGHYFLQNWMTSSIEATEQQLRLTQLKQIATAAELQALKLQIDPHFIFNNLSVLSELILEDQQLGFEYSENFAKVYRYLLVNSRKDWIALEDELRFLESYIFLIQRRIGEGIRFELKIDRECLRLNIPPMTLQLLVENIIKHNQTIKSKPLLVKIYATGDHCIVVENTKIALINTADSAGIGLENIRNRYAILSAKLPEIVDSHDRFKVIVPLIS